VILQILPLSIVRYSTFAHHHIPFAVIIFVDVIYLSLGLFNVLLFSTTRPLLLPHDPQSPDTITVTSRDISIMMSSTFRESFNEVASCQRPESFGFPRCESPASGYWSEPGPAREGSARVSETSLDEKRDVREELKNGPRASPSPGVRCASWERITRSL
jgi:hypothetical protein